MENEKASVDQPWPQVIFLTCAMLSFGVYFLVRYNGYWAENDTVAFTKAINSILLSNRLIPDTNVYSNGYGYQALVLSMVNFTRLDVFTVQTFLAPLLICWIVFPAWLAYRELTGSGKIASLATALLLIQPELLFPLLRGSHEKFTRGLMFLCIYLLARSLRSHQQLRRFTFFLIAFYLTMYAMIAFNNLMAFSFIFGIALALVLFWIASNTGRAKVFSANQPRWLHATVERLLIVTVSMIVVAFLFTFYAYPPAVEQLRLMSSVQERISALFLQVEDVYSNPYVVINTGWINQPIYWLVSLANWILLVCAGSLWLKQSFQWVIRKKRPADQALLLWALVGAFAIQGAISIVVDLSGAIGANLQHRVFPTFAMLGAPLIAGWLFQKDWLSRSNRVWVRNSFRLTISILAVLSTFKSTLEPTLSNNWIFYNPSEIIALNWAFENNNFSTVWSDYNERLTTAYDLTHTEIPRGNRNDISFPDKGTASFMISDITRYRSQRLGIPLPIQADSLRIYDNGNAAIYRRRPLTPYQK